MTKYQMKPLSLPKSTMKMCVSMANTTKLKTRSPVPEKINDSKEKKRSFLGIHFKELERKKEMKD